MDQCRTDNATGRLHCHRLMARAQTERLRGLCGIHASVQHRPGQYSIESLRW